MPEFPNALRTGSSAEKKTGEWETVDPEVVQRGTAGSEILNRKPVERKIKPLTPESRKAGRNNLAQHGAAGGVLGKVD
jgi:hypothetical protein